MKKQQVQIGQLYAAKITDKVVPVRIEAEHPGGGWVGTNTQTKRKVRIKTAQKLRNRITVPRDDGRPANPPQARGPVRKKVAATERRTTADTPRKPRKPRKPAKPRKLSLIDAAARVLADQAVPMSARQMVDHAIAAGLWTPGAGKTPHATLYAAIHRETRAKGSDARFVKAARGRFTLAKEA